MRLTRRHPQPAILSLGPWREPLEVSVLQIPALSATRLAREPHVQLRSELTKATIDQLDQLDKQLGNDIEPLFFLRRGSFMGAFRGSGIGVVHC